MEYPEAYPSPSLADEFLAPLLDSNSSGVTGDPLAGCINPLLPEDCYVFPLVPTGDSKLELGNGEEDDEGFEDFCEDEDALLRHGNPNLPNVQALSLQEINSSDLEDLFLPSTGVDTDDLFIATPLVRPVEPKQLSDELLELDQGVAMEVSSDQPRFVSKTHAYELSSPVSTFSPTANVTTSSFPDVLCSSYLTSPATQQSFTYPTPPKVIGSGHLPDQPVAVDVTSAPTDMVSLSTSRQDSELDLICTILGEDMPACINDTTTVVHTFSTTVPLQLEEVQSLVVDSPPPPSSVLSCEGSLRTDCDTTSLSSSLPSPTPWTNTGQHTDKKQTNKGSQTEGQMSPPFFQISEILENNSESSPSPVSRSGGSTSSETSSEKERFIRMPFYDFKKILDDPKVSERDKEEVKNIRRRGKNKVAAKVCRQRKLDLINGLQHEIDLLKGEKDKLLVQARAEQQKIQWYKDKWNKLVAHRGSTNIVSIVS